MKRFREFINGAVACLISAAVSACANDKTLRESAAIGKSMVATIESTHVNYTYPIYIYLPPSYSDGANTYPVVYATDGDTSFPPDGRFANFRNILQRRGIDAILVAIGGTERRRKDYVLPAAIAYHEFIAQELIPFIESHFRADPKRRVLSGISLDGSFVVTELFLEAPDATLFSHYISAEGSFFQPSFMAQEHKFYGAIGSTPVNATLILARGAVINSPLQQQFSSAMASKSGPAIANLARSLGEETNSSDVETFYRRLLNHHLTGLTLIETKFGTDHVGTDNPSFDDAVVKIFKPNNPQ
jgi:hypothetical protein